MPNANAPAGPGKPLHEREDAVAEQEGLAELDGERGLANDDPAAAGARHTERDAHANDDGAGGPGRHTGRQRR